SSYVAVAQPTEMAVSEAIELQDGLARELGRSLSGVVVNGLLPQRFSAEELRGIERAADAPGAGAADAALRRSAARAARAVHERARFQRNQLARLRRRSFVVVPVPFMWGAPIDLAALRRIAARVGRRM